MVDKVSARPQDVELKVLRATRDLIVSAIGKFEYPGTGMFLILEHAVVGALMAGLSIPDTKKNRRILLERISEDAAQKQHNGCCNDGRTNPHPELLLECTSGESSRTGISDGDRRNSGCSERPSVPIHIDPDISYKLGGESPRR